MKTKTLVELSQKEVTDALIAKAKEVADPKGGGVRVDFFGEDGMPCVHPTASVIFEWGAKAK